MALTFGGKSVNQKTKKLPPPPSAPDASDRIVLFMRLVALSLEARQELTTIVRRRRTLERKLADPALADHPQRPSAERRLAERESEERTTTLRLMDANASLSRQWDLIEPADKHRFALTHLVGEPDPQAAIDLVLWADDRGLARLVPFPPDWTPADDIAHRVLNGDRSIGVTERSREEIFHADYPSF